VSSKAVMSMPKPKRPVLQSPNSAVDLPPPPEMSKDELKIIMGYLTPKELLLSRVCRKWRDAATETVVPMTHFHVDSVKAYNAMAALPNLQQITLGSLELGPTSYNVYTVGEEPDQDLISADDNIHNIEILHNFKRLRSLVVDNAPLNGIYPYLFNFPLLEKMVIVDCDFFHWDLSMLEGVPNLKEFYCDGGGNRTSVKGNLSSLRVLKDSLEKVTIIRCCGIEGDFMALADFPRLQTLKLCVTRKIKRDIRDIGENDFLHLKELTLPCEIYGGNGYEFYRISEVPEFMSILYRLKKLRPALFHDYYWFLSKGSPDWYDTEDDGQAIVQLAPFVIKLVQAGSRLGWRWQIGRRRVDYDACEINWLDPEPEKGSNDYDMYIEELQTYLPKFGTSFYKGYFNPPTEEQYLELYSRIP